MEREGEATEKGEEGENERGGAGIELEILVKLGIRKLKYKIMVR